MNERYTVYSSKKYVDEAIKANDIIELTDDEYNKMMMNSDNKILYAAIADVKEGDNILIALNDGIYNVNSSDEYKELTTDDALQVSDLFGGMVEVYRLSDEGEYKFDKNIMQKISNIYLIIFNESSERVDSLYESNVQEIDELICRDASPVYLLKRCRSLTKVGSVDIGENTNISGLFSQCGNLISVPEFDTSGVTDMSYLYSSCEALTEFPNLNTSNLINAQGMFFYCSSMVEPPEIDATNIENMCDLFSGCTSLQHAPELDTSNVTNMDSMFCDCAGLRNVPVYNTENVTDMSYMFYYCPLLENVPQLNTSNVTNMEYMFAGCKLLTTIPDIDTTNVTNMSNMFYYCSSLSELPNINTSNATNLSYFIAECPNITGELTIDTSNCKYFDGMLMGCGATKVTLTEIGNNQSSGFPSIANSSITDLHLGGSTNSVPFSISSYSGGIYANDTIINITSDSPIKIGYLYYAFNECSNLETLPEMDTSECTDMFNAFAYCRKLKSLSVIDCSSCTSLYNTFRECHSLKELNLRNTHNITNFNRAFNHNPDIERITGIDVSSCTDCTYMFNNCGSLKYIELTANSADKIRFIISNSWLPNHAGAAENEYVIDISGCSPEVLAELTDLAKDGWTIKTV